MIWVMTRQMKPNLFYLHEIFLRIVFELFWIFDGFAFYRGALFLLARVAFHLAFKLSSWFDNLRNASRLARDLIILVATHIAQITR